MKKFLLIALLMVFCICSFAQTNTCYVSIKEKGQEEAMLSLAFNQSHTFQYNYDAQTHEATLTATFDGIEVATLVLNKQYEISYSEHYVPSAVKDVIAKSKLDMKGGIAFISDLKANEVVNVFAANGAQVATAVADANGIAQINLSAMPQGIVIIKAGNASFKLKK